MSYPVVLPVVGETIQVCVPYARLWRWEAAIVLRVSEFTIEVVRFPPSDVGDIRPTAYMVDVASYLDTWQRIEDGR